MAIVFVGEKWAIFAFAEQFPDKKAITMRDASDVPLPDDLKSFSNEQLAVLLTRANMSKTFPNKGDAVEKIRDNWESIVKSTSAPNDDANTEKEKPKSEMIREYFQLVGKDGPTSIPHYEPISKGSKEHQPEPVAYKTGVNKGESRLFPVTSKDVSTYDLKVAIAALKSDATSSSDAKAD